MIFRVFILLFLGLLPIRNTFGQVIRYDTKINIDDKDRKSTERIFLIQINDKKGNWLSHIEISHNPKQEFSLNYAKILDLHGNELRKLKRKDVDTKNDLSHQAFYQDDLLTEFDLYWNQYPYQVEYSYTIAEDEFLYITHWTPVNYSEISTVQATLSISTPSDYAIHINQTDNLSFEDTAIEDRKELKWSASMIDLPDREIYAPPMSELLPAVSIVPANIKYGVVGNCDSWSSFGLWFDHLNRGTDELPLSEKTLIHKLLENVADKKETVKKLYHYLQDHTHYINVAIDVGGLKSYPASYVSRKKYGDCKALTTYMKSMLKSVGIESYYTVIHAGTNNTKINEQFPSQQFNHVILAVPMKNDTIWLENTSNTLPFNYMGTFTQNRLALAVDGDKSKLVSTPKLQLADVLQQRTYHFSLDDGNWQCDAMLDLRGQDFEKLQYYVANGSKSEQEKEVISQVKVNQFQLDNWRVVDPNRDSTNIKINASGKCPAQIREIGNIQVINPLKIAIADFEAPSQRKLDVRFSFPINEMNKSIYQLASLEDKKVQLPENVALDSKYGRYTASYVFKNHKIEVKEHLVINSGDIVLDEYSNFYNFIKSIFDHKKKSAIIIK